MEIFVGLIYVGLSVVVLSWQVGYSLRACEKQLKRIVNVLEDLNEPRLKEADKS